MQGQHLEVKKEFDLNEYYKTMQNLTVDKNKAAVVLRIPGGAPENMKCIPQNWEDFTNKVLKSQLPSLGI